VDTSFERSNEGKDEWITPPYIIRALGRFDLDPCGAINQPFKTATKRYTSLDDGLSQPWNGRIWLNPPYGRETKKWMGKLASHGNGIALIFARTETETFFKHIWPCADAILFIEGRVRFYHSNGLIAKNSAGAPSCLIAYGKSNADVLSTCSLGGKFIKLK